MQCLPITLLIAALMGLSSATANAGGQHKQAQLRVSMTIVDSCDVELVRLRSGAAARDARVECSSFMPHQLLLAPLPTTLLDSSAVRLERAAPAQRETGGSLAALSPADAGAFPSVDRVTVATVTF